MNIYLRILIAGACREDDAPLQLSQGATLLEALVEYVQKYDNRLTASYFKGCVFQVNDCLAKIDYVLKEGDKVTVLRPVAGG